MTRNRQLKAKLLITATLEVMTGLHIGTSSAYAAIGATDSPVIKDAYSGLPMIPGSSLKGKMRTLLAKFYNEEVANNPNQDHIQIRLLFGDSTDVKNGRLIFRDALLSNAETFADKNIQSLTEVKFENTIDRIKGIANPRQIERVVPGSQFKFEIIYDYDEDATIEDDFKLIYEGFRLLEMDYLGGHGSRGYGRIKLNNIEIIPVFGQIDSTIIDSLNHKLKA